MIGTLVRVRFKKSRAPFGPESRAAHACTLPVRSAAAVPYLSRKYGLQRS